MPLPVARDKRIVPAVVLLIGAAPSLVFPSLLPAGMQAYGVPVCLAAAMLAPMVLLSDVRPVVLTLALFEIAVVAAWWHMPVHDAQAVAHTAGLAFGLLLMSTLAIWCRTRARLLTAATLFSLGACLVLVIGVLGTESGSRLLVPSLTGHLRLGLPGLEGGVVNTNAVGGTAMLVAPVAFALLSVWRHATPAQRLVALLASATAAVAVAISGSRTAWAAAALVLVGWTVTRAGRRSAGAAVRSALLAAGGASVAVIVGWAWLGAEGVRGLVGPLRRSLLFRLEMWRQAVRVLHASPWFGDGINQFRQLWLPSPEPFGMPFQTPHAHNMFLQVALDLGLPGLAAYLAVLVVLLVLARRAAAGPDHVVARLAAGAAMSLVAVHAFGLTDAITLGAKVGVFQWASCGLIVAAFRLHAPPDAVPPAGPGRP